MCVSRIYELGISDCEFRNAISIAQNIIDFNRKKGTEFITLFDEKFPKKLYSSKNKCIFLFYQGDITLLSKKSVAVIGTRKPDDSFINPGMIITEKLSKSGFVIVSGLALGCDTIAHSSCLNVGGRTIAVLPSPCDSISPSSNKDLANSILDNKGLLISEYPSGTRITKYSYPERDRIQSLISDSVVVIQATDDGGTRYAMERSLNDGKYVCALKGNNLKRITNYVDANNDEDIEKIIKRSNDTPRTWF